MVVMQTRVRGFIARRSFQERRQAAQAAVVMQTRVRGFIARRRLQERRQAAQAAVVMQTRVRGFIARRRLQDLLVLQDQRVLIDLRGANPSLQNKSGWGNRFWTMMSSDLNTISLEGVTVTCGRVTQLSLYYSGITGTSELDCNTSNILIRACSPA